MRGVPPIASRPGARATPSGPADAPAAVESLKHLLTPSLFRSLVSARIPFDRLQPLDFAEVGRLTFADSSFPSSIHATAFPVLQALSRVGLDAMPDLMTFLPDPSDAAFPEQCLGLILLLDQAPRALCEGIDARWTNAYFDLLSQRLAPRWQTLPPAQRPDRMHRWVTASGTSFDFWLVARFWFVAPSVHAESVAAHDFALAFGEETRRMVELATGTADAYRSRRETILSDTYAFPRVVVAGPPKGKHVSVAEWAFWMCMLMDVHSPIIKQYGRYPYRNAGVGRESTAAEKEWLDKTDHFGEEPADVAKRIREDVEAGRWTPLGEGEKS